jgi:hypothetical protein
VLPLRPLLPTRELLALARRLFTDLPPEHVLGRPHELLVRAIQLGNERDLALLADYLGENVVQQARQETSPSDAASQITAPVPPP